MASIILTETENMVQLELQGRRDIIITFVDQEEYKFTTDDIIDRIGNGRFQKKLLFICGMGYAGDAMEIVIISFLIPFTKVVIFLQ